MSIIVLDSSAQPAPPASLSTTPILWYRTDGLRIGKTNRYGTVDASGYCSQLTDLSGNGNHATFTTGTKPLLSGTINGKKTLTFDGLLTKLTINNLTLTKNIGGFSMFAVAKSAGIAGTNVVNEICYFGTEASDKGRCSLCLIYGTPSWELRARRVQADSPSPLIGSTNITTSTVVHATVDYTNGRGRLYENSNLINIESRFVTTGNTSNADSADSTVGNLNDAGIDYPFNGQIGEIIAVQSSVTPAVSVSVSDELRSFWGIEQPAVTYDAKTTAWLAAVSPAPSTKWTQGLDWLLKTLRADGAFSTLVRAGIFRTEYQAHALVDLIDPTKTITEVGTPTWTTSGYAMTGTSHLEANWIPSTDGGGLFLQNQAVIGVNKTTSATNAGVDFGCTDGTRQIKHYAKFTDNIAYFRLNSATQSSVANGTAQGLAYLRRANSTNQAAYQANALLSNPAATSNGVPTTELYIGGFNNNGAVAERASAGTGYDFWFCGSDINLATFEKRVLTLMDYLASI